MRDTLGWGIMGTGNIANQFAQGVGGASRSHIVAVGSRKQSTAEAFAGKHSITKSHGSYEALLADRDVQAVYISLPNAMHYEWTLKALAAGKHVLCEKPFADNIGQAREMFDAADRAGLLLAEAFMYISHPLTKQVVAAVGSGVIGQVKLIRTSFCYRTRKVDGNVRFSAALRGGGLMDVGCYCVSFSRLMTGEEPCEVHAVGHLHDTGVDDVVSVAMRFPTGVLATFTCGMTVQANNAAHICGDEGYIEMAIPWKPPVDASNYVLCRATPPRMDQAKGNAPRAPGRETFSVAVDRPLYALEADDFAASVLDGKPPAIPRDHTLGNMKVLDELRRQIGLAF